VYIINTDSSIEPHNPGGILSWAFIVKSVGKEKGEIHRAAGIANHGHPDNTNNQGEYYAVIAALLWMLKMPEDQRRSVIVQSDSQLIVNQCSGVWSVNDEKLMELNRLVKQAVRKFGKSVTFKWIPREKNTGVDSLSRSVYEDPAIQAELEELRKAKACEIHGDDDLSW